MTSWSSPFDRGVASWNKTLKRCRRAQRTQAVPGRLRCDGPSGGIRRHRSPAKGNSRVAWYKYPPPVASPSFRWNPYGGRPPRIRPDFSSGGIDAVHQIGLRPPAPSHTVMVGAEDIDRERLQFLQALFLIPGIVGITRGEDRISS